MPLDKDFIFSANSLQDYVDCPRRFELKYILNQSWPAIVSQPVQEVEEKMAMGSEFHRLARQYLEGLPSEILEKTIGNPEIREWFDRFLVFIKPFLKTQYLAEFSSYTKIGNFRVVAVFDFLSRTEDGKIIVADWKTTERQPKREFYQDRIQSLLYPLVAFETASAVFGGTNKFPLEGFSLLYWFPAFPEKNLEFPFSTEQYQHNQAYISNLIEEIAGKEVGEFPETEDPLKHRYCRYRSLCDRGVEAGNVDEVEDLDMDDLIASLSFDQPDL